MIKTNRMKAETIVNKLFEAMTERKAYLLANDFVVSSEITKKNGLLDNFDPQGNAYNEFKIAVDKVKHVFDFGYLISVAAKAKPNGSNDANYIQCKTFEKVVRFVKAFGHKDFRMLDPHTRVIAINALKNNGVVSSKGAFCALTSLEMKDAVTDTLIDKRNYTPGTGSTQLSSTRELFRILALCDSIKGKKDAAIEFLPDVKIALLEHFDDVAKRVGYSAASDDDSEDDSMTDDAIDAALSN